MSVAGAREYVATATIPQSAKEIIEQLCQEIEALKSNPASYPSPQGWAAGKGNPHNA